MTIELLANIDVDDLEQAIELYRDALGLRLGRRFSGSVAEMLEASSAIYLLAKPAGGPSMAVSVNCASQAYRGDLFTLADQLPSHFDLIPDVAHHRASDPAALEIINNARIVFFLPVGYGLKLRADLTDRLIAKLEEIGEEVGHIRERLIGPRHVTARPFPLVESVIPVLDAHLLPSPFKVITAL